MNPRCLFCGEELKTGGRPGEFRCQKCRAVFKAQTDPEGCVIGLAVEGCGADDCCRHKKDASLGFTGSPGRSP